MLKLKGQTLSMNAEETYRKWLQQITKKSK